MDDVPAAAMHSICACMHQFCKDCLERHIQIHMKCKPLPVMCPSVTCGKGIDVDECSVLLHSKEDIALLTQEVLLALLLANMDKVCALKLNLQTVLQGPVTGM